jgi:hypothetical protein
VTSLDPVFRLLVRTLAERQPPRVHQAIAINELMDAVLPYRLVRRELGIDTAEDYESLLLRLCAGEGDFLQADQAAQEAMGAELRKPLPDLGVLRVYGDTHVVLRTDPLRAVLDSDPERRYAPPGERAGIAGAVDEEEDPEEASPDRGAMEDPDEEEDAWEADPVVEMRPGPGGEPGTPRAAEADKSGQTPARCPFCGGVLPPRMAINFCPHCGMGQDVGTCRACGADMDVGWRYCVSCGEEARGGLA